MIQWRNHVSKDCKVSCLYVQILISISLLHHASMTIWFIFIARCPFSNGKVGQWTSCYNMLVYNSFSTKELEQEHETWSKYAVYQEKYSTWIIKKLFNLWGCRNSQSDPLSLRLNKKIRLKHIDLFAIPPLHQKKERVKMFNGKNVVVFLHPFLNLWE